MKHTLIFHTIGLAKQLQKIVGFKTALSLSDSQAFAILTIDSQKAITQKELADKIHLEPASVVTLLDELERLNLVRRQPLNGDRRKYQIQLTPKGQIKVSLIKSQILRLDSLLKSRLDENEVNIFIDSVHKLLNITNDIGKEVKNESFSSKRPLAV